MERHLSCLHPALKQCIVHILPRFRPQERSPAHAQALADEDLQGGDDEIRSANKIKAPWLTGAQMQRDDSRLR